MRPSWADNKRLADAVTLAKRTTDYRRYRQNLRSLMPVDVWADEEQNAYFVVFPLASARPGKELLLGFVINAPTRTVQSVSPISLHITPYNLIAESMSPARVLGAGDRTTTRDRNQPAGT